MRRRGIAIGVAALAMAAATTSAVAQPTARQRVEFAASQLLNRAENDVVKAHPRCGVRPLRTFTHAAPSARLLAMLGVLRRPATPQDRIPHQYRQQLLGDRIELDAVRLVHAGDGHDYYVVPAQRGDLFSTPPRACAGLFHRRLVHVLAGHPATVRRAALTYERRAVRVHGWPSEKGESVSLYARDPTDGSLDGAAPVPVSKLSTNGFWDVSQINDEHPVVSSLLPDGVATITMTFRTRSAAVPPGQRRKTYPPLTLTEPVQDNVVSFSVARDVEDAAPTSTTWRAVDGSVIRTVKSSDALISITIGGSS